ncbi:MAG: ABC transporter ATP-binding protein [Opitutaceae bacterium]|nr:ABC transporter ATP-binding protein [Opitutaceae bacterium]
MFVSIAVSIKNITKDYSLKLRGLKLRAVDGLSLEIPQGEIFGLLGPNGSGKSTTLKILLGLIKPTMGEVMVFNSRCSDVASRSRIGYLPESPNFYTYLTGEELVSFYAGICGVSQNKIKESVSAVISLVGLEEASDRRVGTYSKGMLQRIGLAQALVHDPDLIILDEPMAGVDPLGAIKITKVILKLKERGKTVLLCTHLLAHVEEICDRIAILDKGKLILEGSVESLLRETKEETFLVKGLPAEAEDELQQWLKSKGASLTTERRSSRNLEELFLEKIKNQTKGEEIG